MTKRVAVLAIFLGTVAIAVVYASAFLPGGTPRWAAPTLAGAIAVLMVALMILGAARGAGGVGRLAWAFAFTFAVIAGPFALALGLPPESAGDALWLGLPRRAAIVLYGVGLLPMLVLPIAYAVTFDERTLRPEDLERVRELGALARARDLSAIDATASRRTAIPSTGHAPTGPAPEGP